MKLKPHHLEGECTFCNELAGDDNCNFRRLFTVEEFPSRIIRQSENFVAIPGLGPIGDAYLLVLPIEPYFCFALLPDELQLEHAEFLGNLTKEMRKLFSSPIVFEHGPTFDRSLAAGCCIEHAHMHVVSTSVDLLSVFHKEALSGTFGTNPSLNPIKVESVVDLVPWTKSGIAYLYYETQERERWGFPVTGHIPSQFVRRKLAQELDLPVGRWDWLVYPNKDKVRSTWELFMEMEGKSAW